MKGMEHSASRRLSHAFIFEAIGFSPYVLYDSGDLFRNSSSQSRRRIMRRTRLAQVSISSSVSSPALYASRTFRG